jgi:hypothetical protein
MVSLAVGDKLRFTCQFYHQGAAYSGAKLRCSIGKKGTFGFNEKLWAEGGPYSFPQDVNQRLYQQTVDVTVTESTEPGSEYEAQVKLMGIPGDDLFWDGPANDITIVGAEAVFSQLTVTYAKV